MPAALLTDDDQQFLKAFIDHVRKHGWDSPSSPNGFVDSETEPFYIPSFIGKVNETVPAGTVISSTATFQPMFGPEHPLNETPCAAKITPDRAWVEVSPDVWAGAYSINGKWYISPLECPPTV